MADDRSAEAEKGAQRGGGGGLAMGERALERQREQLRCRWKFEELGP